MTQRLRVAISLGIIGCLIACHVPIIAQNVLARPVTLRFTDERLAVVLESITKQTNCSFAYNASAIDDRKTVDINLINRPLREALALLFRDNIQYKIQGNYIILIKVEVPIYKTIFISGYITDANTEQRLANVSIYEKKSLASAISSATGFYRLKITSPQLPFKITVSKPGYRQQSLWIKEAESITKDWLLLPEKEKQKPVFPSEDNSPFFLLVDSSAIRQATRPRYTPAPLLLDEYENTAGDKGIFTDNSNDSLYKGNLWTKLKNSFDKIMVRQAQRIHAQNVQDTLVRPFQVSLFPFLGTNKLLSGSIENDLSLNIVMGYSAGVRRMEFGGVLNGVRRNMLGFQLAGVGNIVGKHVNGVQVAGVFNTTLGRTDGVALAGGWNHTWKGFKGVQAAGLFNITHQELQGLQMATAVNFTKRIDKGLQMALVMNVTLKTAQGWQVGMINYAHKIGKKGRQIGLLNFADSTETIPIGFLSFVGRGNGFKRLELAIDENRSANFTFKTGVQQFYNVLTLGYNFVRTYEMFNIGYGIGRAYRLNNNWMMNTDLVSNALVEYDGIAGINQGWLLRLDIGFEKFLARNSSLTFGPSIKALSIDVTKSSYWNGKPFRNIPSYQPLRSTDTFTLWVGFQMGIRIKQRYRLG